MDMLSPRLASKYFLKYSENTSVSENTEVLNTLTCLDPINAMVLKLKYYHPKLEGFSSIGERGPILFFYNRERR
jgi:hypothetical protein